jgi:hypothetical protein
MSPLLGVAGTLRNCAPVLSFHGSSAHGCGMVVRTPERAPSVVPRKTRVKIVFTFLKNRSSFLYERTSPAAPRSIKLFSFARSGTKLDGVGARGRLKSQESDRHISRRLRKRFYATLSLGAWSVFENLVIASTSFWLREMACVFSGSLILFGGHSADVAFTDRWKS